MKIVSILLSLLIVVLMWACGSKAETTATTPDSASESTEGIVPVKLTPVTSVVRAEPVVASGLVSSAEEARLSFKVGGIINRLFVEEGQTVRKGQLLATLDLTEIDAQVSQAQLASEKAERDLNRVQRLYADTAATLEQLQNATTGQNASKQALTIAQFNRSYAQIRASVDGTVTRKVANAGEYIAPGASVYLISGNRRSDWVVRVGVSDKDWARLRPGNRATVRLDAYPDRTFTGTISKLAQAADPVNKLYEVEVKITPGGTAKLAPGLFASVTLVPERSRSYAVVPVEAIVEGNGKDGFVYVASIDRKGVKKVPVQIGYLDGDKVLLTNGLSGIGEVVTAGSAFLTEESRVIIK
jgi:multidrug efflux system membrane fusion protein